MEWEEAREWRKDGDSFAIIVRHRKFMSPASIEDGGNRWNVYAYIYSKHPLFAQITGTEFGQLALAEMPLHCGASLCKIHKNDLGMVQSIQVGSDYNHLYDSRFNSYESREDAREVFYDAEALLIHLEKIEARNG